MYVEPTITEGSGEDVDELGDTENGDDNNELTTVGKIVRPSIRYEYTYNKKLS